MAQFALEGTRKAMYAGSWYEADGERLRGQIREFLARATPAVDEQAAALLTGQNPPVESPILAVIVPHAGYIFSGQAAAYAYKAAQGQNVMRIFLLGPSHHVGFHGAALPATLNFATPLGDLEVDEAVVAELKEYPLFSRMPEVHRVEHSLEMQLPFVREVFGEVKIVPIVVGALSDDSDVRLLAEILKGYICRTDLVVVSSDFTHYGPRYQYRPFRENMRENIRKLDSQAFRYLSECDLSGFARFERETKDTICGFFPCSVLAALLPEGAKGTLLKYYTSQDTLGEDSENSVSYLAVGFSGATWPEKPQGRFSAAEAIKLSKTDRDELLKLARATVESYVREKKAPELEDVGVTISPSMKQLLGVFVTLNKQVPQAEQLPARFNPAVRDGKELRGCIGYIWPLKPLYQAVIDNAISACSRDHRFQPVATDELEDIWIEISVLTPPRRVASYDEIVLGRDGIVLFKDAHQAVFLPFVATEFGWSLAETLTQLSRKAGLAPDDWREDAKFDVFQAEVFHEPAPAP